jgi:hexosaminidase
MGAETIQTPPLLYFDHSQGQDKGEPISIGAGADLQEVYNMDIYKDIDISKRHLIRGIQAQIWTEFVPDIEHLWYMVFPRLVAAADVAYLGDRRPPYEEFLKGLPARLERLQRLGIGHRPMHKSSA